MIFYVVKERIYEDEESYSDTPVIAFILKSFCIVKILLIRMTKQKRFNSLFIFSASLMEVKGNEREKDLPL